MEQEDIIIASPDEILVIDVDGSAPIKPRRAVSPVLSEEEKAFADAINRYQCDHRRAQLTWQEIFEIVRSLGYRKVEQPAAPPESNGSPQAPARPDAAGNETPS
jgi:hypothetical protein